MNKRLVDPSYRQESQQESKSKPSGQAAANNQFDHASTVTVFTMVAALGSLLFGYDTGLISGAELYLRKDFSLSPISEEVVVSAILIGGMIGAGVSGKLSNALSRKWSLMIVAAIFAVGAILTAAAPSLELFVAYRILVGFCVGVASLVTPVYITEISPPAKRGVLVTFSKLAQTGAVPVAYGVDLAFARTHMGWRPMFGVECLPGIIVTSIDSLVATIVALFLLDRLGRRPLLLIGLIGVTVSLATMGTIFLFDPSHIVASLVLICLLVYIFAYGIGIGPIFALMSAEIFPTRLRGTGVSIACCLNWAATLLVSITFLSLLRHLGNTLTYWLYALLAVVALIFCWLLVPETKGKSLEQIEHYWENGEHW